MLCLDNPTASSLRLGQYLQFLLHARKEPTHNGAPVLWMLAKDMRFLVRNLLLISVSKILLLTAIVITRVSAFIPVPQVPVPTRRHKEDQASLV